VTPREHHRFFAKQLIPTHTFQSPDKMFTELTGPKREAFLMFLWNEAANAVASPIPHVAVEDGKLAKLSAALGQLQRVHHRRRLRPAVSHRASRHRAAVAW